MRSEIVANTSQGLKRLGEVVHDMWFDVGQIQLDDFTGTLSIPLSGESAEQNVFAFRSSTVAKRRLLLEIHETLSYKVEESEGVGIYDVNQIAFDEDSQLVEIRCGIPIIFQILVTALDVRLIEVTA